MIHKSKLFGGLALAYLLMCGLTGTASAQRGGSGGGGGGSARHGGNYNIVWDTPQPINGRTPRAVGSVNVSTYVAVINMDVKLSSINLPDNTPLTVTVHARDYFTGLPWITKNAGTITVNAQSGSLVVSSLWVTAPGFLPVVTSVVVTEQDGTIVVSGKP